jgi:iron complex outermembrane receptor protein
VSTVIDGVVFSRPGAATLDLMDIERIEILRGPQGTLFGKNASAGVLNIVTKRLSPETERYVDASYYQGNERRLRAGASGQLSAGVLGSISLLAGKYDGNIRNVYYGEDVNGYDRKGMRGKIEFSPTKDLRILFIGDYAKADDTGVKGPWLRASPAITAAIAPAVPGLNNTDVSTDVKERVEDKNYGFSGQFDWNVGGNTVTGITAYRKWENVQYQDLDGTPAGTLAAWREVAGQTDRGQLASKTFSQELRLASAKGGLFDYVAGLYYMKTKTDEVYRRDIVRCNASGTTQANGLTPCVTFLNDYGEATYGIEGKSVSIFGESTWNLSSALRGILGARYTKDDLSYYHSRVATVPVATAGVNPARPYTTGSTNQNGVSGRIGPQFDFSKEVMAYLTYSRGYKGPAYNAFFNMTSTADLALDPEKSKGWEAGLKSTLLDNRLRVNLAVFDTKYTGYQANYPDLVGGTVVTRFINAGDVSTKGVELDLDAKLSKQLTLSVAVANTKARVDRFNCPTGASCPSLDGQPLPFAPNWKGAIRANYWMPVTDGMRMELGADYTWQSQTQYDLSTSANTIQPRYSIYNASIALSNPEKGWRFALVGKNLGDEHYSSQLLPGANTQRVVPRDNERFFGVNGRYEF